MAEEEAVETEGPPPEEASNRTFIILAVLLGGIFVLGLFCIGVYAVFIGPRQVTARATADAINSINTQTIASNTQAAATMTAAVEVALGTEQAIIDQMTQTAEAPTEVIEDTPTPVIPPTSTDTPDPTDTPAATDTLSPPEETAAAETEAAAGGAGGDVTPTLTSAESTSAAQTQAAGGATATQGAATATGTTIGGGAQTPTRLPSRTPSPVGTAVAQVSSTVVIQVTTTGTPGTQIAITATPGPTQLPGTGFAEDAGVPGLIILGLALVGVVIIARRLRMAVR